MKKLARILVCAGSTLLSFLLLPQLAQALTKNKPVSHKAIMIIAHGAPSPQWGKDVRALETQVQEKLNRLKLKESYKVKVALMEFNRPHIAEVITQFEKEGVTEVLAVPLFIAPSGHSVEDIPAILGLTYNATKRTDLEQEGIELVSTNLKIQLAPTLNYGEIIPLLILDRIKEISNRQKKEKLLLIAHGSKVYRPQWDRLMERVGKYVTQNTTIEGFDYAYVEMGQEMKKNALPLLTKGEKDSEQVLVQGVYLSIGANRIMQMGGCATVLKKDNIVVGQQGLLPDDRISDWIVDRIKEWKE